MENTNSSLKALNHLVAAYSIISQNARFCHWNVVGPHFEDDHEFFEMLYNELSLEVDEFAERVRALGLNPISRFSDFLVESEITEYVLPMTARQMQKNILGDYQYLSSEMEQMIESTSADAVTQDMIVGSKRNIDKRIWMLRALLGE